MENKVDVKVVKSEEFALRIVKLYKYLNNEKGERIMSKQILRSGTSIGANIAESLGAESTDDFTHKLSIAQKEAFETRFWLNLLLRSEYISDDQYISLLTDCEYLIKILTNIILKYKNQRSPQK